MMGRYDVVFLVQHFEVQHRQKTWKSIVDHLCLALISLTILEDASPAGIQKFKARQINEERNMTVGGVTYTLQAGPMNDAHQQALVLSMCCMLAGISLTH